MLIEISARQKTKAKHQYRQWATNMAEDTALNVNHFFFWLSFSFNALLLQRIRTHFTAIMRATHFAVLGVCLRA